MIKPKPSWRKLKITASTCLAIAGVVLNPMFALAAEDQIAGQHIFAVRCASCHGTTIGEKKLGPTLAGVFRRASGSATDFKYSPALKGAHLTWDSATLDKWLANPGGLVHGTTMFVSVPSSTDRQNLIAYLKTLPASGNSSPPHGD
jgi:cytochrome c2